MILRTLFQQRDVAARLSNLGVPFSGAHGGGNPIFHDVVVARSPLGVTGDIDRSGDYDPRYNLSNDEIVHALDRDVWVHSVIDTYYWDSKLDGKYDSAELVDTFRAGLYDLDANASWSEGDWNNNTRFDSGDLITAFRDGGFEQGTRTSTLPSPAPEPAKNFGLTIFLLAIRSIRPTKSVR